MSKLVYLHIICMYIYIYICDSLRKRLDRVKVYLVEKPISNMPPADELNTVWRNLDRSERDAPPTDGQILSGIADAIRLQL